MQYQPKSRLGEVDAGAKSFSIGGITQAVAQAVAEEFAAGSPVLTPEEERGCSCPGYVG